MDYVLGLARNARLERMIASEMEQACAESKRTGRLSAATRTSSIGPSIAGARERRVVGKAEYLVDKPNARFVVTSLPIEEVAAQPLYENDYCGAGRHGEPDQRAEDLSVLGSHLGGHDARQSTAALVLLGCLPADERSAQTGAEGHGSGQSAMRHDPAQAVQDRSTHHRHHAQDLDLALEQLSVGQSVRSACAATSLTLSP